MRRKIKYLLNTFFLSSIALAQVTSLKVTVLSTMVADYDYIGEWGFAAIIESDGNQILFDTGFRPNTVLENADSLNIDLSQIEHVFLSHNHLDHVGGLKQLRQKLMIKNSRAMKFVHVGKGIFLDRFSNGVNRNPFKKYRRELEEIGIEFIIHEKPKEIFPHIWTSGVVPRIHNEKNWSGFREIVINGETVEDNIPEDQSLAIETTKGLVLVSGCGHAGIVNTLEHVSSIHGNNSKIVAALGGFHLFNKTNKDISWTAKHMKKHGVKYFLGAHCTGIDAVYQIRKHNKMKRENCSVSAVGSYYDLDKGMYPGLISK